MTFPEPPLKGQPVRAETIRQIIDCLRMFRPIAGANIRTKVTPGGTVINGTPGGGAAPASGGTLPWTVRKHVTEGDESGQWEIWLPPGVMAVGGSCDPLNKAASEKSGHADDLPGWYSIRLIEDEGSPTRTETVVGEDGDEQTVNVRDFQIIAHGKTSAKVYGADALAAPARRLLYVSARKVPSQTEQSEMDDAARVANTWGDEFSQIVATVKITQPEGGEKSRKITQARSTPISVGARERENFDLVWYFSVGADNSLSVERLYCVRQLLAVAGMGVTGDQMTLVPGDAERLFAKIDTKDMSGANGIITVEADPDEEDTTTSGDLVTWLPLYDLTANAVSADYRDQSLKNVQLYRG